MLLLYNTNDSCGDSRLDQPSEGERPATANRTTY
jgi:hypothetical protein